MADPAQQDLDQTSPTNVVSPEEWLTAARRGPAVAAINAADGDPEEASQSIELGKAIGVPAPIVSTDLEGYQRQHKAALINQLFENNEHLRQYVQDNPLGAKLSSDDWGQLDAVSQAVQKFGQNSIVRKAAEEFSAGHGPGRFGVPQEELDKIDSLLKDSPYIHNFIKHTIANEPILNTVFEANRLIQGVSAGLIGGIGEAGKQLGFSDAPKYAEMVFQALNDPGLAATLGPLAGPIEAFGGRLAQNRELARGVKAADAEATRAKADNKLAEIDQAFTLAKPFIEAGKEPPRGLHPLLDEFHDEQTKLGLKNLDEALSEAQSSATRERDPDTFASFIRQHTDARIGISIDGIRELYGDKPPAAGDNLLGWVPDIENQWRLAEAGGGDVEVPLADWLAKADPEVAKELHDHLRVRPGAATLEEMKAPDARTPYEQEYGKGEGEESSTQLAAKFTLEDIEQPAEDVDKGYHDFSVKDEEGGELAKVMTHYNDASKTLYIEDIDSRAVNQVGPAAVRDLLRQLREKFPQAEFIKGLRITGARWANDAAGDALISLRQVAGLDPLLERPTTKKIAQTVMDTYPDTEVHRYNPKGGEAIDYYIPSETWTEKEDKLISSLGTYMKSIAPQFDPDRLFPVRRLEWAGEHVHGLYQGFHDAAPMIFYALHNAEGKFRAPEKLLGLVRHETMHYLYRSGFFTEAEWKTLTNRAEEAGWIKKYQIDKNYADVDHETQLEEAIAHEFEHWNLHPKATYVESQFFQRMRDALLKIAEHVKRVMGFDPAVEDIFHKVESGEIGSRTPGETAEGIAQARVSRERPDDMVKRAAALGMTRKQYDRYRQRMREQDLVDREFQQKQAEAVERKKQTQEWRDNHAQVQAQVSEDVRSRPDFAADNFLREGELYGEKVTKPRLAKDAIPAELRSGLPDYAVGDHGMHPDDVAGLFGYQTGDQLVRGLARLEELRKETGLSPKEFLDRTIDTETNRRMLERFGNLEENILEAAKEHVLGSTQMDMIHDELMGLAQRAGEQTLQLGKGDLEFFVRNEFKKTPVGLHDSDKYLQQAGRAGYRTEYALLEGENRDAFKAKQEQFIALLKAKEAMRLEKDKAGWDRRAKTYSTRVVKTIPEEYTNWIHDILMRSGETVKRGVVDLRRAIADQPEKNFQEFLEAKSADLREIPAPDFLLDPTWTKPVEEMTVEQFQQANDTIKSLIHNARDEAKLGREGRQREFNEAKADLIAQLTRLAEVKTEHPTPPGRFRKFVQHYVASSLQLESVFNRWDQGDPKGPWTQLIMRDLAESANEKDAAAKEFARKLNALADKEDMSAKVANSIFRNPDNGELLNLTRKHLRGALLNMGNPSNFEGLAKGYKIDPGVLAQWALQTATKADWDYVQGIWDIYKELKDRSEDMYRRIAGVPSERIEPWPVQTPHGTYEGGYYPRIYDSRWEGTSKKLLGRSGLEQENFQRATPPSPWEKKRTGYVAPYELNIDSLPNHMNSYIHDIYMREAVLNAQKVFYDKDIRQAIQKHYGEEYKDQLIPYLRAVANASNYISEAQKAGVEIGEFFRQNMIATLIGFNPHTVGKHGLTAWGQSMNEVGHGNFLKAVRSLFSTNDETGQGNWTFAIEHSQELQRREQNYLETMTGAHENALNEIGASWRHGVMKAGSWLVSKSDLLSAVPTWLAKYTDSMEGGASHGEAIYEADRAVRRAHGSSTITNRAQIQRDANPWITSLYGFWSHILNRQYEIAWRSKEAMGLAKEGEYAAAAKEIPEIARKTFYYVIYPAMVEQFVEGIGRDDHTPWGLRVVKGLAQSLASSWIGVRDLVSAVIQGADPSAGLTGTALRTASDIAKDFKKLPGANKHTASQTVKHGFSLFGLLTGLVNNQEGKMAQYLTKWYTGEERPRNFGHVWRGLFTGSQEPKR